MTRTTLIPRALAPLAALALALPALTACQATNPVTSGISYEPGDGVAAHAGPVVARNLVIVAAAKDGPGMLVGMLENSSDQPVEAELTVGEKGKPISVTVPAHGTLQVGAKGTAVGDQKEQDGTVASVPVHPGSLAEVRLTAPGGATTVKVPVHPGTGYYSSMTASSSRSATTSETSASGATTSTSTSGARTSPSSTSTPASTSSGTPSTTTDFRDVD